MDHLANTASLAQERFHKVSRKSAEAEKAFADAKAELDENLRAENPPVSVTCIRPNAKIKNKAPEDSKYRQEYSISIGDAKREFNCWHWWRDPMDGVIRFLGGGSGPSKFPTIYRVEVKDNSHLSFKRDEDQSEAIVLYNKYGHK